MQLTTRPRTHQTAFRAHRASRLAFWPRSLLKSALLLLSALALAAYAQDAERWIDDELRVDMRSGPSFENRIIEYLTSGTRVTVLETRGDWSRVRTGDEEGWIRTQYTTSTPIAADRLEAARAELERLRKERDTLAKELTAARQEAEVANVARTETSTELEQTQSELEALRRTTTDAVETAEALRTLRGEAAEMRDRIETLERENLLLATNKRNEGLKWGAGAVVLGIILAMLASAWGGRKRKGDWLG